MNELRFQLLWRRLLTLVDQASAILVRGAFSPAVADMKDFALTLHDAQGNMLAQSRDTGTISILTAQIRGVRTLLSMHEPSSMCPGDAFISNDPWLFAGHKHDVIVITPLFHHDQLVAFAAVGLHVSDIGGLGLTANGRDVYEEGLEIPIMYLTREGVPNETLISLIRSNVRQPDSVVGDILGQAEAAQSMQDPLIGILDEYALQDLVDVSAKLTDRSEIAMRKTIEQLPDGTYHETAQMDGWEEPVHIAVAVTVRTSDFIVDFDGTDPQVGYGINCPYNVTFAWAAHAARSALAPDIPNNEGCYRPIRVLAPPNSVVNPSRPAPVAARHMVQNVLAGVISRALSQIVPGRVLAESGHQTTIAVHGKSDDNTPFQFWWITNAGVGAGWKIDGPSGTSYPLSLPTIPVEIIERASPIVVVSKRLVMDSGGPGQFRGGFDQEIAFTVKSGQSFTVVPMLERQKTPARGLLGGESGALGHFTIEGLAAHPKQPAEVRAGGVVRASSGGGGGYGEPRLRDPRAVADEYTDGLLSYEHVMQWYPHALDYLDSSE